jgi:predicted enzyme related to lactoylglutathione lyase
MTDVLGFDNVFVEVGDLDDALAFYRDRIGLGVHRLFGELGMALFRVGDERPGLGVRAVGEPRAGGQRVWLEVRDARATAERLTANGVAPLAPPVQIPTGWVVEVADPWGNVLGFTDYCGRPDLARPEPGRA